jgi:hypothetical protein
MPGLVTTDDQLMMAARAAGYSMIPPQDSAETDPETVSVAAETSASEAASAYFAKVRSWLPATPAFSAWLNTRAHA